VSNSIYSHEYRNGLVLVAEPMLSLESAAFSFMTPAGCRYEPPDRLGLAGFTCDMALRGAGERDGRQFLHDLEILGVERSESVNSSHTSFSGATLADNLSAALELYADMLRRPRMPGDEVEASRLVVLQELLGVEDEPSHKVMMELRRHHYPEPLGRPSQGDRPGVESIGIDDVNNFFSRYWRPNGTILGVAGNFDWPALRDRVGELFEDWPTVDVHEPEEGPRPERRAHLHHDVNQTQIGIAYESVPYRDPDYFQASGAIGVLSGGMSSRLFTEVREKRGLCYSVYATLHSLRDRGCVLCYAGTSAERAQETLDVTVAELLRLPQGVRANELDRLKARIKSGLIMQQESSIARGGALARDWYHLGRARSLDEVGALVDALSCESINEYLERHPPRDFTFVTLGPNPLEVPVGVS
jgi:predicted Zn-dependent peptidase